MAQRPYIIWSLGPKALAALACDHLFQAPGMASLVDAAIFLQDKQQTFQQTDDGIIDHQQNYWAKLFDRHSHSAREVVFSGITQHAGLRRQVT